ncbi:hypothetical protein MN116_000396 [Schistosoma mekongi]|uniref:Transmembrane protein n=1 Tax=Schistosoma mekongi TaxID=38744 RepID=A0AAE2D7K1_SCHME|nr:hypothetical protein MN116_000396 [Schistosoma mekongi]
MSKKSVGKPSVVFQLSIEMSKFVLILFAFSQLAVFIYKFFNLPYKSLEMFCEMLILSSMFLLDYVRLYICSVANRSQSSMLLATSYLLLGICVTFCVWLIMWQLFTIKLEIYFISVLLIFYGLNFCTGIHGFISFTSKI